MEDGQHTTVFLRFTRMMDTYLPSLDGFDEIVLATGVEPRTVAFEGSDDERVLRYDDVLAGRVVQACGTAVMVPRSTRRSSPSTAVLSPYLITRPSISTAGSAGGEDTPEV